MQPLQTYNQPIHRRLFARAAVAHIRGQIPNNHAFVTVCATCYKQLLQEHKNKSIMKLAWAWASVLPVHLIVRKREAGHAEIMLFKSAPTMQTNIRN